MSSLSPQRMHGSKFCRVLCVMLMLSVISTSTALAGYDKMKIVLRNGAILEGKYISMDDKEARIKMGGMEKAYPLTEVINIMAKESKGVMEGCRDPRGPGTSPVA